MVAPSKYISQELVRWWRRTRFSPISRMEPEVLSRYLDSFSAGYLRDFALAAQAMMERDDKMCAAMPKRFKAPARHGYSIQINDGLPAEQRARAEQHKEALKYCYDNLTATHALDGNQKGGFRLLARQMMECVAFKYAVHELIWQPRVVAGKPCLTFTARYVPLWFFENTEGRLRFCPDLTAIEGKPMDDGEWLVTVGEGIMIALSVCWMFKQMSLKDWVSFNEKFGTPGLLGKSAAQKGTAAWDAMVEAVEAFGQDWAAVVSQGDSIDLIETKGGSAIPFDPLVQEMNRAIVQIIRGGDLGTMSREGEATGSNAQQSETDLLEEDDVQLIAETLQQISRIVIQQLFNEEPLAYVTIVIPKAKNTDDTVKKIDTLVDRKVPVGMQWARAELGVPEPAEGEELLGEAPMPVAPLGMPPRLALPNNAPGDADLVAFIARATAQATKAEREAFSPILSRLAQIEAITEPAAKRAALERFAAALPEISRLVIGRAPQLAAILEQAIGPALISGFAEHAAKSTSKP